MNGSDRGQPPRSRLIGSSFFPLEQGDMRTNGSSRPFGSRARPAPMGPRPRVDAATYRRMSAVYFDAAYMARDLANAAERIAELELENKRLSEGAAFGVTVDADCEPTQDVHDGGGATPSAGAPDEPQAFGKSSATEIARRRATQRKGGGGAVPWVASGAVLIVAVGFTLLFTRSPELLPKGPQAAQADSDYSDDPHFKPQDRMEQCTSWVKDGECENNVRRLCMLS